MTREAFIKKWLGNPDYQYCEDHKDAMRHDLDAVIARGNDIQEGKECPKCYDTGGKYLGATCPECGRPFRSVKS